MADQVRYDSKIIITFAQRLYDRAYSVVFWLTLLGVLVGGGFGAVTGQEMFQNPTVLAVIGMLLLGGIGLAIGQSVATSLRLRAQLALCQVQIEENTRAR